MLQIDFSSRVIRQETAFDILADDRLSDDDKREELEGKTVIGTYGNY